MAGKRKRYDEPSPYDDEEEWRIIEEFPKYKISSHGRVWLQTGKKHFGRANFEGYYSAQLFDEQGLMHERRINRLVALTFLQKPADFETVAYEADHIDDDPSNNRVDNLQWLTPKENTRKRQYKCTGPNENCRPLQQMLHDGTVVRQWPTLNDATTELCISSSGLYQAIAAKRKFGDYYWSFVSDESIASEIWKSVTLPSKRIVDVSNLGRIKLGRRITFGNLRNGARRITLQNQRYNMHHLIAVAFKNVSFDDLCAKNFVVYHRDKNAENNNEANLIVGTPADMAAYINNVPVQQFDLMGTWIADFPSVKAASIAVGCSAQNISCVLRGQSNTAKGFVFKYANK